MGGAHGKCWLLLLTLTQYVWGHDYGVNGGAANPARNSACLPASIGSAIIKAGWRWRRQLPSLDVPRCTIGLALDARRTHAVISYLVTRPRAAELSRRHL